jgi:hypothetical protein
VLWCFCLLSFYYFHPFLPTQIFSKQPPNTPPVCLLSLIPFLLSTTLPHTPSHNFSFILISNYLLLLIQTTECEGK